MDLIQYADLNIHELAHVLVISFTLVTIYEEMVAGENAMYLLVPKSSSRN